MAKDKERNKNNSLDNVEPDEQMSSGEVVATSPGSPEETATEAGDGDEIVEFWGMVSPVIPVSEPMERYSTFRHIDLRMTPKQSQFIQRARKALHDNHCKLRNGKHVDTYVDTLRYILERLEDGIDTFEQSRGGSQS